MIDTALTWEEGEMKEALVYTIANHMKKCFLSWNKDTVEDAIIFDHLFELSDGKFDLRNSDEVLSEAKELLKNRKGQGSRGNKGKNQSNKNRKR